MTVRDFVVTLFVLIGVGVALFALTEIIEEGLHPLEWRGVLDVALATFLVCVVAVAVFMLLITALTKPEATPWRYGMWLVVLLAAVAAKDGHWGAFLGAAAVVVAGMVTTRLTNGGDDEPA